MEDAEHCRELLKSNESPFAQTARPFDAALVLCIDASAVDWDRNFSRVPEYVKIGSDQRPIVKRVIRPPLSTSLRFGLIESCAERK